MENTPRIYAVDKFYNLHETHTTHTQYIQYLPPLLRSALASRGLCHWLHRMQITRVELFTTRAEEYNTSQIFRFN